MRGGGVVGTLGIRVMLRRAVTRMIRRCRSGIVARKEKRMTKKSSRPLKSKPSLLPRPLMRRRRKLMETTTGPEIRKKL